MVVNDPIADMLTRIRNAQIAKHDAVVLPASNTKKAIAKILLAEGYVKSVDFIDDGPQGSIKIVLKYVNGKQQPVIAGPQAHLEARPSRLCQVRRTAQGAGRPGHRHHLHLQGADDGSRSPQANDRRRSARLHLVNRHAMEV